MRDGLGSVRHLDAEVAGMPVEDRLEALDAVLAGGLGAVQRDVRAAQQLGE